METNLFDAISNLGVPGVALIFIGLFAIVYLINRKGDETDRTAILIVTFLFVLAVGGYYIHYELNREKVKMKPDTETPSTEESESGDLSPKVEKVRPDLEKNNPKFEEPSKINEKPPSQAKSSFEDELFQIEEEIRILEGKKPLSVHDKIRMISLLKQKEVIRNRIGAFF